MAINELNLRAFLAVREFAGPSMMDALAALDRAYEAQDAADLALAKAKAKAADAGAVNPRYVTEAQQAAINAEALARRARLALAKAIVADDEFAANLDAALADARSTAEDLRDRLAAEERVAFLSGVEYDLYTEHRYQKGTPYRRRPVAPPPAPVVDEAAERERRLDAELARDIALTEAMMGRAQRGQSAVDGS